MADYKDSIQSGGRAAYNLFLILILLILSQDTLLRIRRLTAKNKKEQIGIDTKAGTKSKDRSEEDKDGDKPVRNKEIKKGMSTLPAPETNNEDRETVEIDKEEE